MRAVLEGASGSFVNAGDTGFEVVDTGDLAVQRREELAMIGVEFVGDGEVAGPDAITDLVEFVVEFGAGYWVGFGGRRFAGEELFGDESGTGQKGGDGGPGFGWD